ncbi:MAG: bifunctional hydroxymethylpyrimidine kinase/phosphomethylpyrimidine kinase [Myxococcota bacterium]
MRPPTVLTVAGSDPGGGAGIQADLKTFLDHGVFGMSVVTAVTAQNSRGVTLVHPLPGEVVRAQLVAVLDDFPVDAIKVGMVGEAADVVAGLLPAGVPVVVDPVLRAKDGTRLARSSLDGLLARATLVTPNLDEAAELGLAGERVLLKGGHGEGDVVEDRLGERVWRHRRVVTRNTHGTGCTLSAAIAANLAKGHPIEEACERAIAYVAALIEASVDSLGSGAGPLLHGLRAPTR